ncbi:hypothetical protein EVAR_57910_1 [Eumeta japonica]|uniref:Uncharacterized protein n=1 Tax=Eumeta variegata TaxID=151549 RepID=A0A4C1ZLI2_EUMVA|nr:hypothetical protein EVAR_57910_1 [Eumeta japonica]
MLHVRRRVCCGRGVLSLCLLSLCPGSRVEVAHDACAIRLPFSDGGYEVGRGASKEGHLMLGGVGHGNIQEGMGYLMEGRIGYQNFYSLDKAQQQKLLLHEGSDASRATMNLLRVQFCYSKVWSVASGKKKKSIATSCSSSGSSRRECAVALRAHALTVVRRVTSRLLLFTRFCPPIYERLPLGQDHCRDSNTPFCDAV